MKVNGKLHNVTRLGVISVVHGTVIVRRKFTNYRRIK